MSHRRRKVFSNTNKSPEVETITKKRYWFIFDRHTNKLHTNSWNKFVPFFYRRKDVMEYLQEYHLIDTHRIEKLEITILR